MTYRPPIRVATKVLVATRDLIKANADYGHRMLEMFAEHGLSDTKKLPLLLEGLRFVWDTFDIILEHEPPLALRPFDEATRTYTPDACDPAHLYYHPKAAADLKTTGRRPGQERAHTTKGSDAWLIAKAKRAARPPKRKVKIQSRPFPKGSRPFPRRERR